MRPVGQRIDVLEHAEEVRLRDDQRGERAEVLLRQPVRRHAAAGLPFAAEVQFDHFDVLQRDDRRSVLRYAGCTDVGTSTRRGPLRMQRSAISTASASAVAPSYRDAFATSMPVSRVIMVWYS